MIYVPDPLPVLFPLPHVQSLYLRTLFRSALLAHVSPSVVRSVLKEGGITPSMHVGRSQHWFDEDENRVAEWVMGQLLTYAEDAANGDQLMRSFFEERAVPLAIGKYEDLYGVPYKEVIK